MLFFIRESRMSSNMILKPHDIYVLLKLVALGQAQWTYSQLGLDLGMSPSEVHAAIKRALGAGLAINDGIHIRPYIRTLSEFLQHGIRYVFVPDRGELTRGLPTAFAAPVMNGLLVAAEEPPPVWPDTEGHVRGIGLSPLHKSAPIAARNDPALYDLLAMVDSIRSGKARERALAAKELERRLSAYADTPSEY